MIEPDISLGSRRSAHSLKIKGRGRCVVMQPRQRFVKQRNKISNERGQVVTNKRGQRMRERRLSGTNAADPSWS
jgi:hypothetical protein